ncbi:MAG: PilZ domain-containing protein [Hyphomicrobiaceae bacterium]
MNAQDYFLPDHDMEASSPRARIRADLRRYKRVDLNCLGRYMRTDKSEHTCRLINISVGDAGIVCSEPVEVGEHIIAYFDEIGRIEGPVVRQLPGGGFAMLFNSTPHRREKLAAQLTWLINRAALGIPEARRHERIEPSNVHSSLTLPNGTQVPCSIIDVSISGAAVAVQARPPIGTEVVLGRLRAKVVRHHDDGVGLRFLDIQNPTALRRHFG